MRELLARLIGLTTRHTRWLASQEARLQRLEAEVRAMKGEARLISEFERRRQGGR